MRIYKLHTIVLILLITTALGCRQQEEPTYKHAREVMGTLAEVTAVADDRETARAAVEAAYARLDRVNALMSDYIDNSEIGRLNQLQAGQSLVVSPETFAVLRRAADIAEQSGGAFDITCRPLVWLWKRAGKEQQLPDQATLEKVRARVGWRHITLDPETRSVSPDIDELQIDLGGIAKGYALDLAAEAMQKRGARGGLVNVGGDIVAFGRREDGRPWQVGIRNAFDNGLMGMLAVENHGVATSGNQQRFTIINGTKYSHIIDPRTGRPAEQAPSVTVIAPDGTTADACATVFSVLSVEEGKKLAEQLIGVEVFWAWGDRDDPHFAETPGFDACRVK